MSNFINWYFIIFHFFSPFQIKIIIILFYKLVLAFYLFISWPPAAAAEGVPGPGIRSELHLRPTPLLLQGQILYPTVVGWGSNNAPITTQATTVGFLTHCTTAGTPCNKLFRCNHFIYLFVCSFLFGRTHSIQKFPGQDWNPKPQ